MKWCHVADILKTQTYVHKKIKDSSKNREKISNPCVANQQNPTNNALLIYFLLSSDAEILLISTDWAYKSVPNMQKRVCNVYTYIPTELPLCIPPLVVGKQHGKVKIFVLFCFLIFHHMSIVLLLHTWYACWDFKTALLPIQLHRGR